MTLEKYRRIASELEGALCDGQNGGRLPSQREVMAKYNVSSRTVHKAFQLLKQRNAIQTTHCGCFLSGKLPAVRRCFVFVSSEGNEEADDALMERLRELAEIEQYEYVQINLKSSDVPDFQGIGCCESDIGIFVYSSFRESFLPLLRRCRMPFAVGNRMPPNISVNWVDWNHLEIFDNIILELLNRGARRIGFLNKSSQDGTDNSGLIFKDFISAKRSYLLFNHDLDAFPVTKQGDAKAYARFLHTLKHLPDAIVVCGHSLYINLCIELKAQGLEKLQPRLFCWGIQKPLQPHLAGNAGFYSNGSYRRLAEKLFRLVKYSASHPDALPCGLKQHCVVKLWNNFRTIRKL